MKSEEAHASVLVTLTDINDNTPTFFTNHYTGSVSESARIGDIAVAGIRAFDADSVCFAQTIR